MSNDLIPSNFYEGYDNPYVKALVQLVPFWGVAGELIEEKIRIMRSERLKYFFDKLENEEIELTDELIENNEFLHSYFSTLNHVLKSRKKEKIELFALLLKSINRVENGVDFDEHEHFSKILDDISIDEYFILCKLRKLEETHPVIKGENSLVKAGKYWNEFKQDVISQYGINNDEFDSYMARLERTGLYLRITGSYLDYTGNIGHTTKMFERFNKILES